MRCYTLAIKEYGKTAEHLNGKHPSPPQPCTTLFWISSQHADDRPHCACRASTRHRPHRTSNHLRVIFRPDERRAAIGQRSYLSPLSHLAATTQARTPPSIPRVRVLADSAICSFHASHPP